MVFSDNDDSSGVALETIILTSKYFKKVLSFWQRWIEPGFLHQIVFFFSMKCLEIVKRFYCIVFQTIKRCIVAVCVSRKAIQIFLFEKLEPIKVSLHTIQVAV